jgi:hypothetical protein
MRKEDFAGLAQARPHMMIELAKTLATRVAELDQKLTHS